MASRSGKVVEGVPCAPFLPQLKPGTDVVIFGLRSTEAQDKNGMHAIINLLHQDTSKEHNRKVWEVEAADYVEGDPGSYLVYEQNLRILHPTVTQIAAAIFVCLDLHNSERLSEAQLHRFYDLVCTVDDWKAEYRSLQKRYSFGSESSKSPHGMSWPSFEKLVDELSEHGSLGLDRRRLFNIFVKLEAQNHRYRLVKKQVQGVSEVHLQDFWRIEYYETKTRLKVPRDRPGLVVPGSCSPPPEPTEDDSASGVCPSQSGSPRPASAERRSPHGSPYSSYWPASPARPSPYGSPRPAPPMRSSPCGSPRVASPVSSCWAPEEEELDLRRPAPARQPHLPEEVYDEAWQEPPYRSPASRHVGFPSRPVGEASQAVSGLRSHLGHLDVICTALESAVEADPHSHSGSPVPSARPSRQQPPTNLDPAYERLQGGLSVHRMPNEDDWQAPPMDGFHRWEHPPTQSRQWARRPPTEYDPEAVFADSRPSRGLPPHLRPSMRGEPTEYGGPSSSIDDEDRREGPAWSQSPRLHRPPTEDYSQAPQSQPRTHSMPRGHDDRRGLRQESSPTDGGHPRQDPQMQDRRKPLRAFQPRSMAPMHGAPPAQGAVSPERAKRIEPPVPGPAPSEPPYRHETCYYPPGTTHGYNTDPVDVDYSGDGQILGRPPSFMPEDYGEQFGRPNLMVPADVPELDSRCGESYCGSQQAPTTFKLSQKEMEQVAQRFNHYDSLISEHLSAMRDSTPMDRAVDRVSRNMVQMAQQSGLLLGSTGFQPGMQNDYTS